MNIVERSKDILLQVGAAPILYLMIALSVISIAVMLERAWFFFTSAEDLSSLALALEERLSAGDVAGARALTHESRSIEGAIVRAGLGQSERGAEAASEAMASATAIGRLRLERRLSFLGTLGNNAPFVGLLGTVIGIVQAFHELQIAGLGGSASSDIMGAISEALVATAIGLAVAIPAVAAFNYFQRRIRTTLGNAEALEHIVLSHLKGTGPQVDRLPESSASRAVRLSLGSVPFKTSPIAER
jgi:biopolymer transport protein ExbB